MADTCLDAEDKEYLMDLKRNHKYSLDEARTIANECEERVRQTKYEYLNTPRNVKEELESMKIKGFLDQIMVRIYNKFLEAKQ